MTYQRILNADLVANRRSAKGRLVMRLFRIGQALPPRARRFYHPIYYILVDVVMGISLPLQTQIAPGLLLRHGQGIVISWKCRIGSNCEIHQNVTLGEKDNAAPTLGDNVTVGANAVLLGGIHVGSGASIGAGAVVLHDVPAGATAVGKAARIIESSN
ncbi:serine O-acetyltransferase [Rhodococcus cercidiphylli]|uniref:Serine acetyltransferase n=1 Tax=Rhodococcus cercidiphylli TaxID=489916 RepID=A0ABU4B3S8_9NOCA|nr:DapH/DapD/GlmU-related protein [Rhodococcus cercidiphylli]MDV6233160.1 DapH/DapD/GlmU-related protein [Rhodococcus cercidiphylli]